MRLDLARKIGAYPDWRRADIDVRGRLTTEARIAVGAGVLVTCKVVMQTGRYREHDTEHEGKQRRQQRPPGFDHATHYSDYVTIAQ